MTTKHAFALAAAMVVAVFALPLVCAEVQIDQIGQQFSTKNLTVKVGDTIKFANGDDVTHNVSVDDAEGNEDDLGLQKPGEVLTTKMAHAGEYGAHCHIHPKMKMKIVVQ